MENKTFDHERLDVYRAAIEFVVLTVIPHPVVKNF